MQNAGIEHNSCLRRDIRCALYCIVAVDAILIVVLLLSASGIELPFDALASQLSLREERSMATWYSSMLFLLGAMLAVIIARLDRGQTNWPRIETAAWWLAAAGLCMLSIDEIAQIHEWVGAYFLHSVAQERFGWETHSDAAGGSPWVIVLSPALVLCAAVLIFASWRGLAAYPRSRFLAFAAVGCWVIVPFLEMAEGILRRQDELYNWMTITEEPLEIIGATLLLFAFCGRLWLEPASQRLPETDVVPHARTVP